MQGVAGPGGAQVPGELLRLGIALAGEGINRLAPMTRQLYQDVGRRAEAVQADAGGVLHQSIGAVADQTGAQQRCRLQVFISRRQLEAVIGVGHRVLGEAARYLVARVAGVIAEILSLVIAEPAVATAASQPGYSHPLAGSQACHPRAQAFDGADDLVSRNQRQRGLREFPVHHVQVGAADAAGAHPEQYLAGCRPGHWQLLQAQGFTGRGQYHGAHCCHAVPSASSMVSQKVSSICTLA